MSSLVLTQQDARRLVGEIFVYHMPFNQALGLELTRLDADYAEISFANQTML
ncbi:MAG: thioesterase family protein, partial [Pantoea sp.]|nr:thioesterase family protein [Pantoea sp.]